MSYGQLPPSNSGSTLERLLARLVAWSVWVMLAAVGLIFALSLLTWLVVMTVVSLIASVFTGRPAAVTVLWRRWREMTRQRWPQRPDAGTTTPRADAADATGASMPTRVEDVRWREVPPAAPRPSDDEPPRQP